MSVQIILVHQMRNKTFLLLVIGIILFSKPIHAKGTTQELEPRVGHRTAYDTTNGQLILFGGYADIYDGSLWTKNLLNETWVYSAETWRMIQTESSPSTRFEHSMAYDSTTGNIMLFGGVTVNDRTNDLWKFDPEDNSWIEIIVTNPPPARSSNSLIYDSKYDRLILFGGYGSSDYMLNDLWFYYFANSSWVNNEVANEPPKRYGHSMVSPWIE